MSLGRRVHRALSAFNTSNRRWAPIPLLGAQDPATWKLSTLPCNVGRHKLSLVTWNINAFRSRPAARAKCILHHILNLYAPRSPDIVFLQEVTTAAQEALLNDVRVRSSFMVTDAEDSTSFGDPDLATMALLSNKHFATSHSTLDDGSLMPVNVFRVALPSRFGRDVLGVHQWDEKP